MITRSGRSPGEGNGNPPRCSCLEDPKDRGTWQATVDGVTKSQTQLSTHAHMHTHTLTVQTSSMATSNTQDFKASLWCTRSKEMTGSILKCIYVILEHHEFSSITLRVLVILPQTQLEMFKLVSIRRRQLSKERMSFEAATKILRNSAKSLNIKEKKYKETR